MTERMINMLGKRVLFGASGICYLILMFYIGGWFFNLSVLIFALIGTREFYSAFLHKDFHPITWAGYINVIIFYFQHLYYNGQYDFVYIMLAVILSLSLPVFMKTTRPIDIAVTVLGFFYPGIILIFTILLKDLALPYKNYLLILTLFATFSTDTFAYFVGSKFGKKKLCPSISPNKTIEGSLGGLVGSILIVFMVGFFLNRVYNLHINEIHFFAVGLLSGSISQIGDLTASVIKRYCGIKDYGNLLPGHGGILDRLDSLMFTAPIVYMYYLIFLTL